MEPVPSALPYTILVISMDTPVGRKRRAQLNYPHTIVRGVTGSEVQSGPIRELMVRYHWVPDDPSRREARIGSFAAHMEALMRIVYENLRDVIVCEDDAVLVRALPDPSTLPQDSITLMGGSVRTTGPWRRESRDFRRSGKCLSVVSSFKEGVNKIDYVRFRWTGTSAYFVPGPAVAREVIAWLEHTRRVTFFDVWLCNERLVRYLLFPNPFREQEGESQLGTASTHRSADLYVLWREVLAQVVERRHSAGVCGGDRAND